MAQAAAMKTAPKPDTKPAETDGPGLKQAKPGELKALFKVYEEKDKAVKAAQAALDKAMSERSKAVETIADYGKAFTWNGERLIVMTRTAKETGVKTFFFRGEGEREAIEVT